MERLEIRGRGTRQEVGKWKDLKYVEEEEDRKEFVERIMIGKENCDDRRGREGEEGKEGVTCEGEEGRKDLNCRRRK